jgi:vacuolar-type H+-ATPase subunit H
MGADMRSTQWPEIDGAAISRVLRAEQDAERAVARARSDAARRVSDARHEARRISERTDARVARLNARGAEITARQIAELRQTMGDTAAASERALPDVIIARAVDRVAGWLLGESEEP